MDRSTLIRHYFNLGYSHLEILAFLAKCHDMKVSLRQLNRLMQVLGLRRRNNGSPMHRVVEAVEYELRETGATLGYR